MPRHSIRFGVTDGHGLRASTWKLTASSGTEKNDVYLACRGIGHALKASMHDSGHWHVSMVPGYVRSHAPDDHKWRRDPNLDEWEKPGNYGDSITLAFRIIVPVAAINTPLDANESASIRWVEPPAGALAIEFYVLFAAPGLSFDGWPGKTSMGTELIGRLGLDNGETVWVVFAPTDNLEFPRMEGGVTTPLEHVDASELVPGRVRALIFGEHEDGSRVIIDCAADIEGQPI